MSKVSIDTSNYGIWKLTWPVLLLNFFPVIADFFEVKIISHLNDSSLAALYTANTIVYLFLCVGWAFATSATALISRSVGEGDMAKTRLNANKVLSTSILVSILLCGLFLYISPIIARTLLPENDLSAQQYLVDYVLRCSIGVPALFIIHALNGMFVALGNTRVPMMIAFVQILLQLGLSYLFVPKHSIVVVQDFIVNTMELGIGGAGLARSLSFWLTLLLYIPIASKNFFKDIYRISLPTVAGAKKVLDIAIPAILASMINISMYMVFNKILTYSENATQVLAASRAGIAIEAFTSIPILGLATAASVLVGRSLGSQKKDLAVKMGWRCAHYASFITGMMCIAILLMPSLLISFLLDSASGDVMYLAVQYLMYICPTIPLYAYGVVLLGGIQGAGDTKIPLIITVIDMWGIRIPIAWYVMVHLGWDATYAWLIMSVTQGMFGVFGMLCYHYIPWWNKEL